MTNTNEKLIKVIENEIKGNVWQVEGRTRYYFSNKGFVEMKDDDGKLLSIDISHVKRGEYQVMHNLIADIDIDIDVDVIR